MRVFWLILAASWWVFMARSWGPLPALGPLLDLHSGIWYHRDIQWQSQALQGLQSKVTITLDAQGVPHFFAQNEDDLYRAQGFVMASQRLFQMDLSSRMAAATLSELVGSRALEMDRFFLRFGMRQGILRTTNDYMANPPVARMLNAFVGGINAAIADLKDLPPEYKLLQTTPAAFDVSRVVAMAKTLTFSLNGRSADYVLSDLQSQIGTDQVLQLFPEFQPGDLNEFVLPGAWARHSRAPETADLFTFKTHLKKFPQIPQPMAGNGSNNWAVGPQKSVTGHSLFANDTHLGLSLPNIWFENQLNCPAFNVYGVALIDVPGIINGFGPHTAWGPTNGTTDALDYYEVEFVDETSTRYKTKDGERDAQVFLESIPLKGGAPITQDVVWTQWGPLLHREGRYGLVVSWTGFQSGQELMALRHQYSAASAQECMNAFKDWHVPIQNFICADPEHIGLIHAGLIPRREIGEGRFIEEAIRHTGPLSEPLPEALRPQRLDPKEGYLRSANERVVDKTYPIYLGWDYEEPFRARAIRQRLESAQKFSSQDMIDLQNDDFDGLAALALPTMLQRIDRHALNDEQKQALLKLEAWDLHVRADSSEPTLFHDWYEAMKHNTYSFKLPERKNLAPRDVFIATHLGPQITEGFLAAWAMGRVPWKDRVQTSLQHVAKLPGFGSEILSVDGSKESVRGTQGNHGAVYKLVVQLGSPPKAWIQVPGGISGDPFSVEYERNVREWSEGKMRAVEFYQNEAEARRKATQVIELSPGGG